MKRTSPAVSAVVLLALTAGPGCGAASDNGSCGPGTEECSGACVDTDVDWNNCGACGSPCAAGELCSGGTCVVTCSTGYTACPTADPTYCADLDADRNDCGACGSPCGDGEVCSGGQCVVSCTTGYTACPTSDPTYCADLDADWNNCGACGNPCTPGATCVNGECVGSTGCADGVRDGFVDQDAFPSIASCAGTWTEQSLRSPPTGVPCGDDIGVPCDSPADLCAPQWHVCMTNGDPDDLSWRVSDADCNSAVAGPAPFVAASSHCESAACVPPPAFDCLGPGICGEPICCGSGCYTGNDCKDAVWAGQTEVGPPSLSGCSSYAPPTAGAGVLCCSDYPVGTALASCAAYASLFPFLPDGIYMIDPDGAGGQPPFQAYCDATTEGGGWTLIAGNAHDAVWDATNMADAAPFGVLSPALDTSVKSPAFAALPFTDLMFVSAGEVAVYAGVGDGSQSYWALQSSVPAANCGIGTAYEWAMTAGDLSSPRLCSLNLYINVADHDVPPCNGGDPATGPGWSATNNEPCPLDDPAITSFVSDAVGIWDPSAPLLMYAR